MPETENGCHATIAQTDGEQVWLKIFTWTSISTIYKYSYATDDSVLKYSIQNSQVKPQYANA